MSQHDFDIANQLFPATRADLNAGLQALASNNSGASLPASTVAGMWAFNTTDNKLYLRNEANTAWLLVGELTATGFLPYRDGAQLPAVPATVVADQPLFGNAGATAFEQITPTSARTKLAAAGLADANVFTALQTIESSDAGATAGPDIILSRASASPAVADSIGVVRFNGKNSAAATVLYGAIRAGIGDPVAASEDGYIIFETAVAGSVVQALAFAQGLVVGAATGGDMGNGTVNAIKFFRNGTDLTSAQTLTDAATIAWDLALGALARVTLANNRTMGTPTNLGVDVFYALMVIQDGTGGRTLSFPSLFKFVGGTAPTLTTTLAKRDIFTFWCDGTNLYEVGRSQALG